MIFQKFIWVVLHFVFPLIKLYFLIYIFIYLHVPTIDVPRPLINDLWVFLYEKIDVELVKWASRVGTSVFAKAIIVHVNKCLNPFFLYQHINIVNTVTLQTSFIHIFIPDIN